MSFLSRLGSILAKVIGIATGIGPIIQPFLGSGKGAAVATTAINDLTQIGQVVVTAEALIQGTGTGATKLAAATPLVAQIVQTSEMFTGKHIANETLFIQGCSKITGGVADCMNSLDANVPTSGQSLTGGLTAAAVNAGGTPKA